MSNKTPLENDLEVSTGTGKSAKYDEHIKRILANINILAWILVHCIEEFKGLTLQEASDCIEGKPEIAERPLYPGKVQTLKNEDKIPDEGEVTFDIVFTARTPTGDQVRIYFNIEPQSEYNPGYDLLPRGIFYGARILSGQLDHEFTTSNYDGIKKVYSIWICMDVPKKHANTITRYSIEPTEIGKKQYTGNARYDLLTVIMIRLGEVDENSEDVHRMLNTLLSNDIAPIDKVILLERDFDIRATVEIKEELSKMSSFEDLIIKKTKAKTRAEETAHFANNLIKLIESGEISVEVAAKALGESKEDFMARLPKPAT